MKDRNPRRDGRGSEQVPLTIYPGGLPAQDFARRVMHERAQLALDDPAGEADAIAPMTRNAAREQAIRTVRPPRASGDHDDRDLVIRLGGDPNRRGGRVPCPAHGGRDRNLSWRLSDSGRLLLTCHSHHCDFASIVAAVS